MMNSSRLRAQRGENLLDVLGGRNEPIHRDEDWHLDHNEARAGYLGVGHASCNLAAGANKANGRRRPEPDVQLSYRWSHAGSMTRPSAPSTATADATQRFRWERRMAAAGSDDTP